MVQIDICDELLYQVLRERLGREDSILERLSPNLRDQGVGIVALGQKHESDLPPVLREGQCVFQRSPSRLEPGSIAVETKYDFAGQAENLIEMLLRGGGA